MIRLTYASSALHDWNAEELLQLLKQCRTNNSAKNITGILLYTNMTFFQVLEGDDATVDSVFAIIAKDPRHKDCTLISRELISERQFPYWSMGFDKADADELGQVTGLNDFFAHNFTPSGFATHKNIVSPLLAHLRKKLVGQVAKESHEELPTQHDDPFIKMLHHIIRFGVKALAVLMVILILLGIIDVAFVMYEKIMEPHFMLMTINDMLETFGAFLAVLIAIEIFLNITLYIRSDVIPVKLVVATALMAISRKVIVFDYKHLPPEYVNASALVLIALGVTYWLLQKSE